MADTILHVGGRLLWQNGDVPTYGNSKININVGGVFDVSVAHTGTWGAAAPHTLEVLNNGSMVVGKLVTATINGTYWSAAGRTEVNDRATLRLGGTAKQTGASTFMLGNGKVILTAPGGTLEVRDGILAGVGTVQGNLVMGYDAPTDPVTTPALSPGGGEAFGTIRVEGNFQLLSGEFHIEIFSPVEYDRLVITGNAAITWANDGRTRKVFGRLMPAHAEIKTTDQIPFMTYATVVGMNSFAQIPFDPQDGSWTNDRDATHYWFQPVVNVPVALGDINGKVWQDTGALAGVQEVGEVGIQGVVVRLFDAAGVNQIASTTTDSNGEYLFEDIAAGVYVTEFARPSGMRFTPANAAPDNVDSDPDPVSGRVQVAVFDDLTDVDAGLYSNTPPTATNATASTHKNTTVAGDLRGNVTDADGDPLTFSVDTNPAHGTLTLNPDGTYTYTPHTNYTGSDSFVYEVADGYGGTDTATVDVTVTSTSPPTGVSDGYSAPVGISIDALNGVLANDTNPNGGLVAVLVSGPDHGAIAFYSDGSFTYTPDDDFVGADSFTYRPADANGAGDLTTVSLTVTDSPPEAVDDEAETDEDEEVVIEVLGNDTDPDNDTLTVLGASDGLYGTTAVNPDGTITYTPSADWYGTDWFTYVIDDGYGRLAYATVEVTVDPVNDDPEPTIDTIDVTSGVTQHIYVLGGTTDVDGDTITITGVTQGSNGTVTIDDNGTPCDPTDDFIVYEPDENFVGADTFTYTVSDGNGGTATVEVSAEVSTYVCVEFLAMGEYPAYEVERVKNGSATLGDWSVEVDYGMSVWVRFTDGAGHYTSWYNVGSFLDWVSVYSVSSCNCE